MAEDRKSFASLLPSVNLVLVVLGLAGTLLLLAGYIFSLGYYSTFHISTDTASMTLQQNIPQAFYLGLSIVVEAINMWKRALLVVLGYACFFIFIIIVIKYFIGVEKTNTFIDSIKSFHKRESEKSGSWYRLLHFMYIDFVIPAFWIFLGFIGIVFFGAILAEVYNHGASTSQQQISTFQQFENTCMRLPEEQLSCTQVFDRNTGQLVAEGLSVFRDSNMIILFDGEKTTELTRNSSLRVEIFAGDNLKSVKQNSATEE